MNCKNVQEWLPLYVGRDLEEKRAQKVTAHMQSCAECAGSADEYREARQLLQQFAPPPFSETVYSGIRQRVLREIEQEAAAAAGFSRLFERLFRPRLRWAVATALVLAVSVFAFYFILNRRANLMPGRRQLADSRRTAGGPTSASIKESEELPPASHVQNRSPVQGLGGVTHQSQQRRVAGGARDRTRPATVDGADTGSMTAEAVQDRNQPTEPHALPARDPATSEKTLRVEMQTKDPNIRIIWFSPQPTKQASPNKSSKGT
jgi:hypothetical protein